MEKKIITVHKSNIEKFVLQFNDMNKYFKKHNMPEAEFFTVISDIPDCFDFVVQSAWNKSNVKGIDVSFEGVVDLVDGDETAKVYKFNNSEISKLLPTCKCEECGKAITRNKYIVFSKTSEIKSREDLVVLGTTCAKKYFPFNVQNYFTYLASELDGIEHEYSEHNGALSYLRNTIELEKLYYAVAEATDNLKCYEKDGGTKMYVSNLIFDCKWCPNTKPAFSFEEVSKWLIKTYGNIKDKEFNDFTNNIHSVLFENNQLRDRVRYKFLGLAVYAFIGAKKEHEKQLKKEMERKALNDTYFGNVKDKFQLELTFDRMFWYDTQFGTTFILLFRDNENRVFKWSTANGDYINKNTGVCTQYEAGHKYLIKGSIKEHSEYNGVKQTVITRCKVLDDFENEVA